MLARGELADPAASPDCAGSVGRGHLPEDMRIDVGVLLEDQSHIIEQVQVGRTGGSYRCLGPR